MALLLHTRAELSILVSMSFICVGNTDEFLFCFNKTNYYEDYYSFECQLFSCMNPVYLQHSNDRLEDSHDMRTSGIAEVLMS
jgi:hypothetical protein